MIFSLARSCMHVPRSGLELYRIIPRRSLASPESWHRMDEQTCRAIHRARAPISWPGQDGDGKPGVKNGRAKAMGTPSSQCRNSEQQLSTVGKKPRLVSNSRTLHFTSQYPGPFSQVGRESGVLTPVFSACGKKGSARPYFFMR